MAEFENIGTCYLCDGEYSRQGMSRHLSSCLKTNKEESGPKEASLHLFVDGGNYYWLHILAHKKASLYALDQQLRRIWLECCGHLSAFYIDGVEYSEVDPEDSFGGTIIKPMSAQLGDILKKGSSFGYIYDFGSSTELKLKVVGAGIWSSPEGISLIAQNLELPFRCCQCNQLATDICSSCIWEDEINSFYCEECASEHPCGEDMLLPVVNSPRMGVCGYCG